MKKCCYNFIWLRNLFTKEEIRKCLFCGEQLPSYYWRKKN